MAHSFTIGAADHGPLLCDLDVLIDTRALIQANSGGGKSWAVRRVLEQTHGRVQHLVIDPEGEFATLREKYDYVYAAAKDGDTVAHPRSAALLAERLLELGVSTILDIYDLKKPDRVSFVKLFLEALVESPKKLWHPVLVVVDEAHIFAPEKGFADSTAAVIDLATRGRKRGFSLLAATQRLAKLHKDVAAELNNKLIGRTTLDIDLQRACDELGFQKARWHELKECDQGDFFATGPAFSVRGVTSVHVGEVQTTHPKAGARIAFTPPPPTKKVKEILSKLADLPAEAEDRQRSIAEFQAYTAHLERELMKERAAKPATAPERIEVPVLTDKDCAGLRQTIDAMQAVAAAKTREAESRSTEAKKLEEMLTRLDERQQVHRRMSAKHSAPQPVVDWDSPKSIQAAHDRASAAFRALPPDQKRQRLRDAKVLRPGAPQNDYQQSILDALARFRSLGVTKVDRRHVAALAGKSPKSSAYNAALAALRTIDLIDYVDGDVVITEGGLSHAAPAQVPTKGELIGAYKQHVLSAYEGKLLDVLVEHAPGFIDRARLSDESGLSEKSSAFNAALASMRKLGIIDYAAGQIGASQSLFL